MLVNVKLMFTLLLAQVREETSKITARGCCREVANGKVQTLPIECETLACRAGYALLVPGLAMRRLSILTLLAASLITGGIAAITH